MMHDYCPMDSLQLIVLVFMFRCIVHLLFDNAIRTKDENIRDTDIIRLSIYGYFYRYFGEYS